MLFEVSISKGSFIKVTQTCADGQPQPEIGVVEGFNRLGFSTRVRFSDIITEYPVVSLGPSAYDCATLPTELTLTNGTTLRFNTVDVATASDCDQAAIAALRKK